MNKLHCGILLLQIPHIVPEVDEIAHFATECLLDTLAVVVDMLKGKLLI